MSGEQRTRALLGPADPARDAVIAPPRLSAHDLIVRAESAPEPLRHRRARPARRLAVVAAVVVAAAAGATAVIHTFGPVRADHAPVAGPRRPAAPGSVLVPVAYQFTTDAHPAEAELHALAARISDAPYDGRTGRYAYHEYKDWGSPITSSPDGRYVVGETMDFKVWQADDGAGRQIQTALEPQYPDQASRDYWESHPGTSAPIGQPLTMTLPRGHLTPLPSNTAGLADVLDVRSGGAAVAKQISMVYGRYVVPRRTRADILRVLAGVPGFVWRGNVVDRAGRAGVAVTFDDREHAEQVLLIFNPTTGELLAQEMIRTDTSKWVSAYRLILATDRTDQLG
ncbi:MAG TPA: CU044_5270 family protein [Micromonosporaceae bacterium]